eukprot:sb/3470856/
MNPSSSVRMPGGSRGGSPAGSDGRPGFQVAAVCQQEDSCDSSVGFELALRLDGSMGRLMYVNYRCYGWLCQLRWRVVLRAEGCQPLILGPSIDIVWNEGAELVMTSPIPPEFDNKSIQILLEMRCSVLFDPSVDGCSAPEVETAVSARQQSERERFVLERSWEAKYLKYKKESSSKAELMKIKARIPRDARGRRST